MRTTPLEPWIEARIGARIDTLERYQLARLQQTVMLAAGRSPFYRHLLAGVPMPRRLADLGHLPFTTAADVVAHGRRLVCVSQDEVARVVTLHTSGTTGPPKRFWFTAADQELTVDFFRVGMSTFTRPGDRVLVLLPVERRGGVGDLLATAVRRLGAEPVCHGVVRDLPGALAVLRDPGVDVVVGIPAQVLALARSGAAMQVREVLLSTDHVPVAVSRALEAAWGCRVFGHYGMTETGLGFGVECEARRGYHLREADLLVEVVDAETGLPVPDGEEGEVAFTTLTRLGMPLIRYRTGDLSRFVPGACPCGAALPTLARVTRRAEGVLPLRGGGTVCLADLDEALFAADAVVDFDAELARGHGTDRLSLAVRVAPSSPAGSWSAEVYDLALERIPAVHRARARGTLNVKIDVAAADGAAPPLKRRMRAVTGDG